jgi:hypothetical protein
MMKKHLYEPGLWILLLSNLFILLYYFRNPDSFHTLVIVFWLQSVLIGFFNALAIFLWKNRVAGSFTVNQSTENKPGCAGIFFIVHYGAFHVMYFVFLITIVDIRHVDWLLIRVSFWLLLAGLIMEFLQNTARNRSEPVNIGALFFMPYVRVIPMHLLILAPAFLKVDAPLLFIILKMLADIITYFVYQRAVFPKQLYKRSKS